MRFVLGAEIWLALTAAIAVHEIAHAGVARRRGVTVREVSVGIGPTICTVLPRFLGAPVKICLFPILGACRYEDHNAPRGAVAWSAAAGPLASIAIGILVLGITNGLAGLAAAGEVAAAVPDALRELFRAFVEWRAPHPASIVLPRMHHGAISVSALFSILLGVTNLLPVPPLDGWKVVSGIFRIPTMQKLDPVLEVLGTIVTTSVFVLPYAAPYIPRATALGALISGSAAGMAFVLIRGRGR